MAKGTKTKVSDILQIVLGLLPAPLVGLACAAAVLIALERGYEGSWYKLSTMIHRPESAPPAFGYRLLFPFLAGQLQKLAPSLTDHNCFIAVQSVVIAITVYLLGRWASLFLPKFGRLFGYALLPLMLCPTLGYWTFYDIAIVGFWTACLLLLHQKKFLSYLVIFAIATLNHENSLLLVPVAVLYGWRRMKLWQLGALAGSQVAVWVCLRYLVISLVAGGPPFDNRLWQNLTFWRHYDMRGLFFAWVILLPWWLMAFMGWKYAPPLLRCSAISLPGLFAVTMLFGRLAEARMFDAFIPTCIGLIACWLHHETGGTVEPPAAWTAGDPLRVADHGAAPPSESGKGSKPFRPLSAGSFFSGIR
jgi:hypothetical protein